MDILLKNVPEEFFEYCKSIGHEPIDVLKGFIGDFCELKHFVVDGTPKFDLSYSSNGSDERMLANQYVERAFPKYDEEL